MSSNAGITVKVEGLSETQKAIVQLMPSLLGWSDKEVQAAGQRVINRTKQYPPPIPGSSYQRTGIYGATFELRRIGLAAVQMDSDASQEGRRYSPFVGGGEKGEEQAAIHQGRWPVFRIEADLEAKDLEMRLNTQAIRTIGRLGL